MGIHFLLVGVGSRSWAIRKTEKAACLHVLCAVVEEVGCGWVGLSSRRGLFLSGGGCPSKGVVLSPKRGSFIPPKGMVSRMVFLPI